MAQPVKTEEDASDNNDGASPDAAVYDEDDLQILHDKHAAKEKYPPGCPVWHGLATASSKRVMGARRGVVESVHVDLGNGERVYKIAGGNKNNGAESRSVFVPQDGLAYASGCPVIVRGVAEDDPEKELEGTIVCPRPGKKGCRSLAYSVQFLLEGDGVRVELGVDAAKISFRRVEGKLAEWPMKKSARDGHLAPNVNGNEQRKLAGVGETSATASGAKVGALIRKAIEPPNNNRSELPNPGGRPPPPVEGPRENHPIPAVLPSVSGESHGTPPSLKPPPALGAMPSGKPKSWVPPTSVVQEQIPRRGQGSKKLDGDGVYSRLTVPLWATASTNVGPFLREVGKIENETGCNIEASPADDASTTPMRITITPMWDRPRYDMMTARERIEDALSECVGGNPRLLYEMALTHDGASHLLPPEGRMVHQRHPRSNGLVWMTLVDFPALKKDDVRCFSDDLQRRVHRVTTGCSVEVFGRIQLGAEVLQPFALICGECKENVAMASKVVADFEERQRQNKSNQTSLSTALAAPRKRAPPTDFSSLSSDSAERPTKKTKVGRVNSQDEEGSKEATCILTVPLWVQDGTSDDELFYHLIGRGGQKTKAIRAKTTCSINLIRSNNGRPMTISIKSESAPPSFRDVTFAKRMIVESLLEYIDDANSEDRLVYEMGMTAEGTYNFPQRNGAVKQECHVTNGRLWMKLLELPSAEVNGELVPHGRFLLGREAQQDLVGTTSTVNVEPFCFKDKIPRLSGPYVLVNGDTEPEVNEVAERIADAIDAHMQGCSFGCRFVDE